MKVKIIVLIVLLFLTFGCDGTNAQNTKNTQANENSQTLENSQTYKLPSGKEIKINAVGKMNFQNGDSALVMNYETGISIENIDELSKEVDEIWSIFQKDVERAELKTGIIRASHFKGSGVVRKGKGYGFVYVKGEDGKWHRREDQKEKNKDTQ